jgi:para-nitrobenzyl esterase
MVLAGDIYMVARRILLRATPIVLASMAFLQMAKADSLTVKTEDGKVHGKLINNGLVRAFQGIPYAAPPVGDLRWKAPQPALKWKGDLDATKYGHHCAQNHVFDDMIFQDAATPSDTGSEDCLTLNVYTPDKDKIKGKLPVMFWIHGGGYSGGSASEPRHNGDFMPQKGVVLVTINYRLGVFGFLALPELAAEQDGSSGNYGLMDMVAALQWVKKNIGEFGGDPNNVSIFGESAGSFAVSTLMAAPSAQGLFAKAIGESGGALAKGTLSLKPLSEVGPKDAEWVKSLGMNSIADFRKMPTEQVLEAAGKKDTVHFSAVIDGKFLTESVLDTFLAGKQAHVPLIAGFNRDEGAFLGNGMTVEKWKAYAAEHFPDRTEEFLKLYPATTDAEAQRSAADYGGDAFIAYGTWKWIEIDRKTGDPDIYRYKLDLAAPTSKFHPGEFAFHSDDIEYIFGTLDTRPGAVWRPEDRVLSDQMMSYWTNFARTGNPNGLDGKGQKLPNWPKYGAGDPVLHLDAPITSRPDENRARYEFWMAGEK